MLWCSSSAALEAELGEARIRFGWYGQYDTANVDEDMISWIRGDGVESMRGRSTIPFDATLQYWEKNKYRGFDTPKRLCLLRSAQLGERFGRRITF